MKRAKGRDRKEVEGGRGKGMAEREGRKMERGGRRWVRVDI